MVSHAHLYRSTTYLRFLFCGTCRNFIWRAYGVLMSAKIDAAGDCANSPDRVARPLFDKEPT